MLFYPLHVLTQFLLSEAAILHVEDAQVVPVHSLSVFDRLYALIRQKRDLRYQCLVSVLQLFDSACERSDPLSEVSTYNPSLYESAGTSLFKVLRHRRHDDSRMEGTVFHL
jgi:hypothetical protein